MQKLLWGAALLALFVVPLGAFVRLSDAGLGCPDWPGCYGHISPHHAQGEIAVAEVAHPHGSVSAIKAWKEMSHRYIAALLGVLVLAIWIVAFYRRRFRLAATGLLGVLLCQALLGMWTVTLLLKPAVVTAHLIVGMLFAAGLVAFALVKTFTYVVVPIKVRVLIVGLFAAVVLQIVLGGWVSSNYAALACLGFPECNGQLWPSLRFQHAFHIFRPLGETAEGALLPAEALVTIHWMHRVGALLVTLLLLATVLASRTIAQLRIYRRALLLTACLQLSLGIASVWYQLPLWIATAHNVGALMLLIVCLLLLISTLRKNPPISISALHGCGKGSDPQ